VTFRVRLTEQAERDLDELFDFIIEREVRRDSGNPSVAMRALATIRATIDTLRHAPFTCRKAGKDPLLRELVTSFVQTGCVALFEIVDSQTVDVLAVRHQREDDYH
jgi:plasmid stabilization system protein ParE